MGRTFTEIPAEKIDFIRKQEVFWVATAPLSSEGHVNVSPKGLRGTFHVESPNRVWYEDLSGSGCETIAHLRENGRITIMFNAFQGPPDIVRLYGKGTVYELGSPEYSKYIPERKPGSRALIVVDVHRVGTSCGWGVPYYKFEGHRQLLLTFWKGAENKDDKFEAEKHEEGAVELRGMKNWWRKKNTASIDGIPALQSAGNRTGPLAGKIPDPSEAGFRRKNLGGAENAEEVAISNILARPTVKSSSVFENGNVKVVYGVVLGFFGSFVIGDIAGVVRRAVLNVQ